MSFDVTAWAWDQELPMTRKMILLCLADWADADGKVYPSVSSIAKKCGMAETSVKTVRRELQALREAGLVSWRGRVRPGTSEQTSHEYTVHWRKKVGAENPHLGADNPDVGADSPTNQSHTQSLNQSPSHSPTESASPLGDEGETSLRSHHAEHDARALTDLAELFYRTQDVDYLERLVELHGNLYGEGETILGHLTSNCWGEEGTWSRIDTLVRKAEMRGKDNPVRYGAHVWATKLHGITHGHLAA